MVTTEPFAPLNPWAGPQHIGGPAQPAPLYGNCMTIMQPQMAA